MKTWNSIKPTLFGAIVAAGALSLNVHAADEALIELIPADALMVMHAKDAKELPERLKDSPLGQTLSNGKFQKFIAPMMEQMKADGKFDAVIKSMEKALDTFEGETVVALNRLPLDAMIEMGEDLDSEDPKMKKAFADAMVKDLRMVIIGNVAGDGEAFSETWHGLIEQMMEESKEEGDKYEMVEEEVDGQKVHVARETPAKVDKSYDVLAYTNVGGIGIVGTPRAAVDETIASLKKGLAGAKLTEGAFGAFHKRNPDNDAHFHLNLTPLLALGKKAALKAEADGVFGEQAAGMGATVENVWKALGLSDLQSLDLGMTFDGESTQVDTGLLFTKRSGLMNMLAYQNNPMPKTDFIPQDVASASVSLFSFEEMYTSLMDVLGQAMPAMMPMVKAQLQGAEGQLGMSIEKDLFGNLKPEIVTLQAMGADVNAELQDEMVVMAALKNEQGFEVAFDKLLTFVSGMTGMAFEPSEFLGQKLHSMEVPGPEPMKVSYLFTKGYFVLSVGKGELLRKVLSNIERPGKSLWDTANVKAALSKLEPGYCEVNYLNAAQMMVSMTELMSQFPQQDVSPFDWEHKLSKTEWETLLGFVVGAAYMEKNGFFGKAILLPDDK